ncbi:MAG: peptide-methionine (S)-S-oxide reductase MsrA [Cellvibrionaceae bacterium]
MKLYGVSVYRELFLKVSLCLFLGLSLGALTAQVHGEEKGKTISVATFGGGCFWCMEPPFDKLEGVLKTESGYSGGHVKNPTYKQVVRGNTGHVEVVQVSYDAKVISYQELLAVFWRNIDPYDNGGQFCDRGYSYRPVIFAHDDAQIEAANLSKEALNLDGNKTPVEAFKNFYSAEKYHQDYYQKNPVRYKYYRYSCGRDQRLSDVWDKIDNN